MTCRWHVRSATEGGIHAPGAIEHRESSPVIRSNYNPDCVSDRGFFCFQIFTMSAEKRMVGAAAEKSDEMEHTENEHY